MATAVDLLQPANRPSNGNDDRGTGFGVVLDAILNGSLSFAVDLRIIDPLYRGAPALIEIGAEALLRLAGSCSGIRLPAAIDFQSRLTIWDAPETASPAPAQVMASISMTIATVGGKISHGQTGRMKRSGSANAQLSIAPQLI
jgi:hypothetical protein